MGSSAPAAPTPPDPVATASAQGAANVQTAVANTFLQNPTQITPYGSSTMTATGSQAVTMPDGTVQNFPTFTSTQALSPAEQTLFDQQNQLGMQANDAASQGLSSINDSFANPVTADSLPTLSTQLGVPQLNGYYDPGGQIQNSYASGGAIQSSVPVQQTATTFGNTATSIQGDVDMAGITQARDDATNSALARLQPQMDRSNAALQSQLANQGVTAGSQAYNDALLQQAQGNNDQRLGAVQVGDAEQQAAYGQALSSGQFHNAAQQQDYEQQQGRGLFGMQADAQNNAANLAAGQFANSAQAQGEQENAARAAFGNAAQEQQNAENQQAAAFQNSALQGLFGMNQNAATFANQAREQQLSDQETINNNAVNQVAALMHGGQVTAGQYQGYSPGQIGETPISQDTYASANLAEQNYQTESQAAAANNSAMFSALGGLFGMGTKAMSGGIFGSDRRIKRAIRGLGTAPNGLPIYAFRYLWDGELDPLHFGHMADEVALVRPDAVHRHPSGFDMVDYGAL